MECRVCGCTEQRGCITLAGPCHRIRPGLCSACVCPECGCEDIDRDTGAAGVLGMTTYKCRDCEHDWEVYT